MLYGGILNFYWANVIFAACRNESGLLHENWLLWCWSLMQHSMTSARATSFALLPLDSIWTPWKGRNSKINSPRAGSLFLAGCQLRRQNSFPRICTSEPARRLHFAFFSNSLNPLQKGLNLRETGPSPLFQLLLKVRFVWLIFVIRVSWPGRDLKQWRIAAENSKHKKYIYI